MSFCETVACLKGEMAKHDTLLNSYYKSLMNSLPQEQAAKLKTEQIQWVKNYVKLRKDLEDGDTGACSSVLQYLGEEVEYVKIRAIELKKMAK
ncbi:lysozyme inhibitor LprI family protein [Desulfovibrio sp. TomC]|uniref:lysozyme inhibitor LprI family protein n=1 Tax=Desulfovibrio sp. TomC TaxID=1562888 RepID=UPI0022B177DE|nr:lysozyme inhibitor LprI family protein [Desulfovibrio sp. TomC]